jgi:beta-lactamase regulating signal transducer with metallopeptidase domain
MGAQRIKLEGIEIPTFLIQHPFPVVAVVGAFRPRFFIAEKVIANLSDNEIRAAIAHERGHLSARDNLKRAVLRGCRDSLTIAPCGRTLDSAWTHASEEAADELAVGNRPEVAMDLASALIKIARLVPDGTKPTMPAAAYLIGEADVGTISNRVKRLLEIDRTPSEPPGRFAKLLRATPEFVALLFVVSVGVIAFSPNHLAMVHSALEWMVTIFN